MISSVLDINTSIISIGVYHEILYSAIIKGNGIIIY